MILKGQYSYSVFIHIKIKVFSIQFSIQLTRILSIQYSIQYSHMQNIKYSVFNSVFSEYFYFVLGHLN